MTRPCGCQRDPAVFGHDHPGEPVAWIMRAIWHAPLHVPTGPVADSLTTRP